MRESFSNCHGHRPQKKEPSRQNPRPRGRLCFSRKPDRFPESSHCGLKWRAEKCVFPILRLYMCIYLDISINRCTYRYIYICICKYMKEMPVQMEHFQKKRLSCPQALEHTGLSPLTVVSQQAIKFHLYAFPMET